MEEVEEVEEMEEVEEPLDKGETHQLEETAPSKAALHQFSKAKEAKVPNFSWPSPSFELPTEATKPSPIQSPESLRPSPTWMDHSLIYGKKAS